MSRVAIACQGGGSHTAFTAGVLAHVLEHWDEDDELVGRSGTSGGAVNAVASWFGLATGGRERAVELFEAVLDDVGHRVGALATTVVVSSTGSKRSAGSVTVDRASLDEADLVEVLLEGFLGVERLPALVAEEFVGGSI